MNKLGILEVKKVNVVIAMFEPALCGGISTWTSDIHIFHDYFQQMSLIKSNRNGISWGHATTFDRYGNCMPQLHALIAMPLPMDHGKDSAVFRKLADWKGYDIYEHVRVQQ